MKYLLHTIFLLSLTLTISGCTSEEQPNREEATEIGHSAHSEMQMETGEATDHSIYNVSSTWKNRNSEMVPLESLKGKVQVVAMLYTHCEFACPRILADMRRIRDSLSDEALQATNFTIISIDPKRDTPERLQTFANENNLSEEHWTLLSGDDGNVLEMAALLGVKYKRISDTDFSHSNIITVLNQQGEIAYQQMNLGDKSGHIVQVINKLAD